MKDIYLKFFTPGRGKDIKGESRDKKFIDFLEISTWQHLIRQPKSATASTAGGHTSERCEHADMIFTKDLDKTSPVLWEACSAGTSYDKVEIHFLRSGGTSGDTNTGRTLYLKITLRNAIIASVTPSVLGEGIPTETFALKYASVKWEYVPQDLAGKSLAATSGAWSLTQNTATENP
jgi:type VI secretion system secreted protein Hcp